MAIKGKTKSKSKKPVAAGPKPAYVPVRTPLMRRRGFWIAVVTVVAIASVAGITYGFAKERTHSRDEELAKRLRTAMTRYQSEVDPILAGVGTPSPPSSFTAMPSLTGALTDLQKGTGKPSAVTAAAQAAADAAKQAKSAYDALSAIDVTGLIANKGFDEKFAIFMLNSQKQMVSGLKSFEQTANLISLAAGLQGDEQAKLLKSASAIFALATSTFNDGYSDYVEAQFEAGTFQQSSIVPGSTGAGS